MVSNTYTVCKLKIGFIDNSYWDDGSRYTSRILFFKDEEKMLEKIKELKTYKFFTTCGESGENRSFNIQSLTKITEEVTEEEIEI